MKQKKPDYRFQKAGAASHGVHDFKRPTWKPMPGDLVQRVRDGRMDEAVGDLWRTCTAQGWNDWEFIFPATTSRGTHVAARKTA